VRKEKSVLYFEKGRMKIFKGAEGGIFIGFWFGVVNTEVYNQSHKKTVGSAMGARRDNSFIIQLCIS
jgi:hypothetical protein